MLKRKTKVGKWMGEETQLQTGSSRNSSFWKWYVNKDLNEVKEKAGS